MKIHPLHDRILVRRIAAKDDVLAQVKQLRVQIEETTSDPAREKRAPPMLTTEAMIGVRAQED